MRINLFGGAGCGKSTTASRVYSKMKMDGYNCELVQEFIKPMAYANRFPTSFGQLFVFANQLHQEDRLLPYVNHIISDSPVLLQCVYAKHYKFSGWEDLVNIACKYEDRYPSLNIYLHRSEKIPYKKEEGRFQERREAMRIDKKMIEMIRKYIKSEIFCIDPNDFDLIMKTIYDKIGE